MRKERTATPIETPARVARAEHLKPLADLLNDTFITSAQLAERWCYSEDRLSNLRKAGKGPSWIRFDTGGSRAGIRYRLSEVVTAEHTGTCGPISLAQITTVVAACSSISVDDRARLIKLLETLFG